MAGHHRPLVVLMCNFGERGLISTGAGGLDSFHNTLAACMIAGPFPLTLCNCRSWPHCFWLLCSGHDPGGIINHSLGGMVAALHAWSYYLWHRVCNAIFCRPDSRPWHP